MPIRFALCSSFCTQGTCDEWGWRRPNTWGVSLGGDLPTHPLLLPSGYYMRRQPCDPYIQPQQRSCGSRPAFFFPSSGTPQLLVEEIFGSDRRFYQSEKRDLNMPRSFLVKKYFSNKKPYHRESQLESQSAFVPESLPRAELPTQDNSSALTCYPTNPLFNSVDALPAPLSPVTPASLPPSPLGPLDLSSSPSSSSGEEEDDGGRTSDPPSPDIIQHNYHCLHCSKRYTSLSALSNHQKSHHQLSHCAPLQQTPPLSTEVSSRPAFHCKHCPKEYTSLGALKMHIRSHTLPCVCPTCGKAFSRPWLLRGHIRTHTGERPFACQHCNRAFADRSNLRAHLQTHSEVKKYQCGSCSRTFSRMSLLHKHNASGCCPAS